MNIEHEEMLDIVDKNDEVISTMPRSEVYAQDLCSQMRSVWLLIKNEEGKLWIPRRCNSRPILPGYLDGSVVGHVQAGETYQQAMIREAQEEVGIDMSKIPYKLFGKITPHEDESFCFATVYECALQQAPANWNQREFSEWFWLSPQELMQKILAGEKVKDTLPIILQKYYGSSLS